MTKQNSRRFRPTLWPTLGTIVGLALLIALGTWQLTRYLEKLELEEEREARLDESILEIDSLADFEAKAHGYSAVALRGELAPNYTFLFKHRVHEGEPGYWLGGVLRFAKGDGAVLINRGWVHREKAHQIAELAPPKGVRTYVGLVHAPERIITDTATRNALASGERDLRRDLVEWDTYDLEGILDALQIPAPEQPSIVVLGPDHSQQPYPVASLEYVTEPYLTSERHLSYVVFWYATAIALLSLYLGAAFGYLGSGRR